MLCEGSGFPEGEDLPYSWFHYRPIRRPSTWNKDSQRYWTEQREMAFLLGCPMPFGPVRPPAYPSHWLRQRAPPIRRHGRLRRPKGTGHPAIRLDSFGSKTLPFRSQIINFRTSGSAWACFRSRNSQMIPDDKQTFPLLSADYSCAMELITLCKRIEIMSGLFVVLHDIFISVH